MLRGLRPQLALFYLAVSLPAMLLIEQCVLTLKYQRCLTQLDDGRVDPVLAQEAAALAAALDRSAPAQEIEQRLQRFLLELERPRQSLGTSAAYVLLELADHPFRVELRRGQDVAAAAGPELSSSADLYRRQWQQPLPGWDGHVLVMGMAVPQPWTHLGQRFSFEWPMAFAYTLLFLVATAWFLRSRVLRRIERIGSAARAWAGGDFAPTVAESGRDEIAELAQGLNRMAAELQTLVAARAQLASMEERRRLARDLHDTVKQKVFALSLQLAAAQRQASTEQRQACLSDAAMLVDEIQRELGDQLRELREDAGVAEDLVPALRRRADDFRRRSGIAVQLRLPPRMELPPAVVETLLRIVDEAMTNVWRHSGAGTLGLELQAAENSAQLRVSDDGKGGAGDSATGMGLANMRLRALSLPGGSIHIRSAAGQGTTLELGFALHLESA